MWSDRLSRASHLFLPSSRSRKADTPRQILHVGGRTQPARTSNQGRHVRHHSLPSPQGPHRIPHHHRTRSSVCLEARFHPTEYKSSITPHRETGAHSLTYDFLEHTILRANRYSYQTLETQTTQTLLTTENITPKGALKL